MNQVYFVVKMLFDANGRPIEGTQQYVSVLADGNAIQAAEKANKQSKNGFRDQKSEIRSQKKPFQILRISVFVPSTP